MVARTKRRGGAATAAFAFFLTCWPDSSFLYTGKTLSPCCFLCMTLVACFYGTPLCRMWFVDCSTWSRSRAMLLLVVCCLCCLGCWFVLLVRVTVTVMCCLGFMFCTGSLRNHRVWVALSGLLIQILHLLVSFCRPSCPYLCSLLSSGLVAGSGILLVCVNVMS
jgi:hypothetical protein